MARLMWRSRPTRRRDNRTIRAVPTTALCQPTRGTLIDDAR
jgi:hypothetical protein